MPSHIKTTIDIASDVFEDAKRLAVQEGTSFRALVEEGLRHVLAARRARRAGFRLRRASFNGHGLSPEFAGESWPAVRDAIYRERGA